MLGISLGMGAIGKSAVDGWVQPTNKVRNPRFTGGAAPSTLPTNMFKVNFNGLTVTYAFGTMNGLPYWDVAFSGTTIDALGGALVFETTTGIPALNGQRWRAGAKVKLQAGSLANITGRYIHIDYNDSGGGYLGGEYGASSFTPTAALTEFSRQFTIAQVGCAFLQPYVKCDWSNGVAINCTLRIINPFAYRV